MQSNQLPLNQNTQNQSSGSDVQLHQQIIVQPHRQTQSDIFKQILLKCSQGNQAQIFCCQQNCRNNASICNVNNCKCKQNHKKCIIEFKAQGFKQRMKKKIIKIDGQIKKELQGFTDKIVDQVSLLQVEIQENFKMFGLSRIQEQIYNCMKISSTLLNSQTNSKKQNPFMGHSMHVFKQSLKKSQSEWFQLSIQKYLGILNESKKQVQKLFFQIEKYLNYIHAQYSPQRLNSMTSRYFSYSKVIPTKSQQNQKNAFMNQFNLLHDHLRSKMNFKSIKQIFAYVEPTNILKSSNIFNNVLSQKKDEQFFREFMQSCKQKQNILLLMETSKKRKFGVFLQKGINLQNQQWISVEKNKSFLFSLTNNIIQQISNQKFGVRVKSKQKCIQIGQAYNSKQKQDKNGMKIQFKDSLMGVQVYFAMKKLSVMGAGDKNIDYQFVNGVKNQQPNMFLSAQPLINIIHFEAYTVKSPVFSVNKQKYVNPFPLIPPNNNSNKSSTNNSTNNSGIFNNNPPIFGNTVPKPINNNLFGNGRK